MTMILSAIGTALCAAAAIYALLALVAVRTARGERALPSARLQPVSVLKPLHGDEPSLYENLCSFCAQDYPRFQVLFGARDAADPALAVARRVQREFAHLDITVVADPRLHGHNYKVSNLANLYARALHPWLVIADSDIHVGTDYLRRVCAPLARPAVGMVTCLYRSRPRGAWWQHLGGLFIDEWFVPSVRLTRLFGSCAYGFGATLAFRRATLEAIGGFGAVADELADDYRLGELTRKAGLETVLSDYVVTTDVAEPSVSALLARELRWMRTIRMLNPAGYTFMAVSFDTAIALLGTLLARGSSPTLVLLAITLAARSALHFAVTGGRRGGRTRALLTLPLVPLRDTLNLFLWGAGFVRRRVAWAGRNLDFDDKGLFRDIYHDSNRPEAGHVPPENTTT